MSGVRAVVLDLDGTLIDTVTADFRACSALFAEQGRELPKEWWAREVCGDADGYPRLFALLAGEQEALRGRLTELWDVHFVPEHIRLLPGVRPALTRLRESGRPLAVASSSDGEWVRRWLDHYRIGHFFAAVVSGDQVPRRKPDPAVHLRAAAELGVPPGECLAVEDSTVGVTAARAAGMRVAAVPTPYTAGCDYSAADVVLPSLAALDLAGPDLEPLR